MEFFEAKDNIMHDCSRNREDFAWETSVRLTLVGSEDIGMYLEEREGRKRKWQGEGKMMRREEDEREQRKMPPKKIMATLGDMGGSGTSSSSSHMSPGWTTNDLDLELPGELTCMGDTLGALSCALPGLSGFKQEALSPPGNALSRRAWLSRRAEDNRQITSMVVDNRDLDDGCQQASPNNGVMISTHSSPESMQCQPMPMVMPLNGYHSPNNQENKGLLIYSPNSLDSLLQSTTPRSDDKDDNRFQYVLAAATSIATKQNEESLTYLNQGQPYEIKLKKLGDLAPYKQEKKIFKSVIKICFHERRLQYMEREQIAQWHAERPGERIIEVDVPLSYGVTRVEQPTCLNALHIYWDPTKDVGVYIKVNCISTEFTAKKHGGEKGVPFRIQVETYLANEDSRLHAAACQIKGSKARLDRCIIMVYFRRESVGLRKERSIPHTSGDILANEDSRLHAAACQIKVFKLKGADRKHKQDREKVMRRPPNGPEKYQPGCEATVLSTLSNDALLPPPSVVTTSPPYSPEMCGTPKAIPSPTHKPAITQPAILASNNQMKPLYCSDGGDVKVNSPPCHSPGAILPDLPQPAEDPDRNCGLSKDATAQETQAWLTQNRFTQHVPTFTNFSGADLLRLSRDDIIQICGLADGIRLFNALHAKRIEPRLTVYVCPAGCNVYSALYLHACRACELVHKLRTLLPPTAKECETVLVSGPNGAPVRLTDELVRHLPDNSTYRLEKLEEDTLLLSPTGN